MNVNSYIKFYCDEFINTTNDVLVDFEKIRIHDLDLKYIEKFAYMDYIGFDEDSKDVLKAKYKKSIIDKDTYYLNNVSDFARCCLFHLNHINSKYSKELICLFFIMYLNYEDKMDRYQLNRWFDFLWMIWDKITLERYFWLRKDSCVMCFNCVNCKNCDSCFNCVDCYNCIQCGNCKYCEDCEYCSLLDLCYRCRDCSKCVSSRDCRSCTNCSGEDAARAFDPLKVEQYKRTIGVCDHCCFKYNADYDQVVYGVTSKRNICRNCIKNNPMLYLWSSESEVELCYNLSSDSESEWMEDVSDAPLYHSDSDESD